MYSKSKTTIYLMSENGEIQAYLMKYTVPCDFSTI